LLLNIPVCIIHGLKGVFLSVVLFPLPVIPCSRC
jgi:hypothetical protein